MSGPTIAAIRNPLPPAEQDAIERALAAESVSGRDLDDLFSELRGYARLVELVGVGMTERPSEANMLACDILSEAIHHTLVRFVDKHGLKSVGVDRD